MLFPVTGYDRYKNFCSCSITNFLYLCKSAWIHPHLWTRWYIFFFCKGRMKLWWGVLSGPWLSLVFLQALSVSVSGAPQKARFPHLAGLLESGLPVNRHMHAHTTACTSIHWHLTHNHLNPNSHSQALVALPCFWGRHILWPHSCYTTSHCGACTIVPNEMLFFVFLRLLLTHMAHLSPVLK